MNILEISTEDLKKELNRRNVEAHYLALNTIPTTFPQYKKVDGIVNPSSYIYLANVDDGCEGCSFLIKSSYELTENDLENLVRHAALSPLGEQQDLSEGEYMIESIYTEEVGRYSLTFLETV